MVLTRINMVGNNCTSQALHNYCGQGDELFLLSLVPIATHAIAYNLVFMTALEFISAQAPLKMKGLLVTFWYALSSQAANTITISANS